MLKIKAERLLSDLQELAKIGATADGGVSRSALSPADIEGRAWFKSKIAEAGLAYHMDGAGNQSAILYSNPPSQKRILAGSHLDSVPNGGRYDGALGTLVAFEALRTIKEAGLDLPITLEAINFTDEESAIMVLMGSRSLTGLLKPEDFAGARISQEILEEGLNRLGITQESMLGAVRNDVAAWVECHIEQGTRLEEAGMNIGVVNAIVGIRSFIVTVTGEAAHSGTKPMTQRKDALWGTSQFILRAKDMIIEIYHPGVMNVGRISAHPGAFNIVPAQVQFALEFRHGSENELNAMQADLFALLESTIAEFGLTVHYEALPFIPPAPLDESVMSAIEKASDALNLTHGRLLSFAGHDTQAMSTICPSAMFFVPSVKGISHNPNEYTKDEDCINGANVILQTLLSLLDIYGN